MLIFAHVEFAKQKFRVLVLLHTVLIRVLIRRVVSIIKDNNIPVISAIYFNVLLELIVNGG